MEMIYQKLKLAFADVFDEEDLEINSETSAADIMGWDSLNHLRLIAAVERLFAIKFATIEIRKAQNVGEFVRIIESKLS